MWRLLNFPANIAIIILAGFTDELMARADPMRGHHNMKVAKIPFIVSLASKRVKLGADRAQFCLGSLIAPNLVLTAAHCLVYPSYKDVEVIIGPTDLKIEKPKFNVQSWTTFAQWAAKTNPRMKRLRFQDLAVITLRNRVCEVTPGEITTLRTADLAGRTAKIVGWTNGLNGKRRFLKKSRVQILTAAECEERFRSITNVWMPAPEGVLCTAANPFTLSTVGDSGGPLLDEKNQISGITTGICPEYALNCTEEFADRQRFNLHIDLIDEFRQFIDDMKTQNSGGNDFMQDYE